MIIVNWNTKALLLDCLRTVEENIEQSTRKISVCVVDNASTDGSVAAVREAFPNVSVEELPKNIGFAAGNNVALRKATARYCLLLNSDTLVPVGVFHTLIRFMDESPQTAVCSPLLLNADKTPQICWSRFQTLGTEIMGQLDRSQSPYPLELFGDINYRFTMVPFPVDWVGGACFMVRREAATDVGLLDEGFFMYSEETEWCHRFGKAGWQTRLFPSVTVTHLGGQSSNQVKVETRKRMYRSLVRLYRIMYGSIGGFFPSAVAWGRFVGWSVRSRFRKDTPKPS